MIVKSHSLKRALLTALADEEMVKITNFVMYSSKSFNDIVLENNDIPRTTTFRKIKWLLNEHILNCHYYRIIGITYKSDF